jgi:hypothetical protein
MMMPMLPMHMPMRNLFLARRFHTDHGDIKAQCFARMRVVAIQHHHWAFDFEHVEHLIAAISSLPAQLAAHLHAKVSSRSPKACAGASVIEVL